MPRFATIDVGTNSVLLLVAERSEDNRFFPVVERAEITRLGRGVDTSGRLNAENLEDTLRAIEAFVSEARALGTADIAVSATSAARDAVNGQEFIDGVQTRTGVVPEIISGNMEAELSYAAAYGDFGDTRRPLVVVDIGGGSTEVIVGQEDAERQGIFWHHSFDVGSVRMSERFSSSGEWTPESVASLRADLRSVFCQLPSLPRDFQVVGLAGTVTTLLAIELGLDTYDAKRIHGNRLTASSILNLAETLSQMSVEQRKRLPGLHPKRADVIPAGAWILQTVMESLKASDCLVSDRGLRWGLMYKRFGLNIGTRTNQY